MSYAAEDLWLAYSTNSAVELAHAFSNGEQKSQQIGLKMVNVYEPWDAYLTFYDYIELGHECVLLDVLKIFPLIGTIWK